MEDQAGFDGGRGGDARVGDRPKPRIGPRRTTVAWVLAAAATSAYGVAVLLWSISLARKDASIVDAAWGPMFLVVAIAATTSAGAWSQPRALLILGIVALWALRLSAHVGRRLSREGEDPRYAAMRERSGEAWWWQSLFKVFLFQATMLLLVSLVLVEPIARGGDIGALALAGTLVAVAAIAFEAVADEQLRRFREDPANQGKVLDTGLWAWSRHPNYFGEAALWWGLWLVALGVGGAWWTVLSPVVMTFLLLKVSGVPLLEKRLESTRPGYAEYAKRTSAFVPLPPKGT